MRKKNAVLYKQNICKIISDEIDRNDDIVVRQRKDPPLPGDKLSSDLCRVYAKIILRKITRSEKRNYRKKR